jgi:hypothetical protein
MNRVEEKVKDIVEVCPFVQLQDFAADPALTLASYHFTDITSDLMAKWIERIATVTTGVGTASALAGFRGVGKSHFLAAIASILAKPELRSQIPDEHVRSVADSLARRAYHVALVRRGSGTDLLDEIKSAVASVLGVQPSSLGNTVTEVLHQCSVRLNDQAFVIFFDTALGRESRVSRDDGALLSEVAEVGKSMGIFVGVALDDDISGADGPNSSITRSFVIDYLDQEHLFKIVDTHIFSKDGKRLPLLREIYEFYRQVLPGFIWSEQRFLSLYPMHPATLEVAPLIRLYIQDFALLGFASEAGVKILGRPANSLIGLDEMFDSVEQRLRGVTELKDAFAAFERLEREVVAKAPVAIRLHAKLVLKGLFLLSLDGQGATADGIAAGMMIFSEGSTKVDVASLLKAFVAALPQSVSEVDGKFRLGATSGEASGLDEAAAAVSDEIVWEVLLRQAAEKFSDIESADKFGAVPSDCTVEWRGAIRRGQIMWRHESFEPSPTADWTIFVERRGDVRLPHSVGSAPVLLWRVAELTEQERATLRRFHVLRTDPEVREKLGDGLTTAMQIHSIGAQRAWQRVFLQDARLTSQAEDLEIFDEATGAHTLSQVMSRALEPYFEALYPEHPRFDRSLGADETSRLVANFFGGGAPDSTETLALATSFALPLGLASPSGESLVPTASADLMQLPLVIGALGENALTAQEAHLANISARLGAAPLGLTREAQHLVLAALVAQGQFDFVTANGDRINHRSLDLQIIWDDIEGIAPPRNEEYASGRLLSWAKLLTGNSTIKSIDRADDRERITEGLRQWLVSWTADNTLAKFDALPDDQLNTAVWRMAAGLKRTFGATAEAIEKLESGDITLAECLKRIADLFSDSEAEHEQKIQDLALLNKYVLVSGRRAAMQTYVSTADWTGIEEIDGLRRELLPLLKGGGVGLNGKNDHIEDLSTRFREAYAAHFVARHADVTASDAGGQALRDIMSSELWSAFQGAASIALIDRATVSEVEMLLRKLRTSKCPATSTAELTIRPVCVCGSGLSDLAAIEALPRTIMRVLDSALAEFRIRLVDRKDELVQRAKNIAPGSNMEFLLENMLSSKGFPRLSAEELCLLRRVFAAGPLASTIDEELEDMFGADAPEWIRTSKPEIETASIES